MSEWWIDESQLKGNQLDVLDIELNRNLAIFGPPGSGKTNLIMLRANHLNIAENPEFYVVTYTSFAGGVYVAWREQVHLSGK